MPLWAARAGDCRCPRRPMKAYYAARAPYYDDVYGKPERREDIAFLRDYSWASRDARPGSRLRHRLLDAIHRARRGHDATDAVAEPLELARATGRRHMRFALADAYDLPERLGASMPPSRPVVSHVPIGRRRVLASLHRRLMPGARVVLLDNSEVQCASFPSRARPRGNTTSTALKDGSVHGAQELPGARGPGALVATLGSQPNTGNCRTSGSSRTSRRMA